MVVSLAQAGYWHSAPGQRRMVILGPFSLEVVLLLVGLVVECPYRLVAVLVALVGNYICNLDVVLS